MLTRTVLRALGAILSLALVGCGGAGPGSSDSPLGSCPPSPAPGLFANALCLCGDLASVGASITTSSPAGAASVGVNGRSAIVGDDHVGGSFAAYGGVAGTGRLHVDDDLTTPANVTGVGLLSVGHDLSVGGDLTGVGELAVGGTLRVAGARQTLGLAQVAATGAYSAPAGPPCPCDGSTFIDVAAHVAAAKAKNDNGAHGLPTSLAAVGAESVTLPTGSYYFDHVETVGRAHFVVDGVVALYLDGSLDAVGDELVELKPNATLDLWVAGAVRTVGRLAFGGDPSAVRLYVGGAGGGAVLSVGLQELSGAIYAPTARVAFVGDTTIHGALFAHDLDGVGLFSIDYAAPQAPPPAQCGGNSDGGTGGGTPTGSGGGSTGGTPVP